MRLLVLVLGLGVTLVLTASAAAVVNPVRATMSTSSTTPLVDTPWRYTITVKDQAGKPVAAKVRLQILLGTVVVGCWKATGDGAVLRGEGRYVDRVQGEADGGDHVARAIRG